MSCHKHSSPPPGLIPAGFAVKLVGNLDGNIRVMDWRQSRITLRTAEGYAELGMHEDARRELLSVPGTFRHKRLYLEKAIEVYRLAGNWQKCRELATQLITVDPMNVGGYVTHAYATRRADSLPEARKILLRAEKLHPREAIIKFNLGCYAAQLGEHENAVTYVKQAVELDDTYLKLAAKDPDLEPVKAQLIVEILLEE